MEPHRQSATKPRRISFHTNNSNVYNRKKINSELDLRQNRPPKDISVDGQHSWERRRNRHIVGPNTVPIGMEYTMLVATLMSGWSVDRCICVCNLHPTPPGSSFGPPTPKLPTRAPILNTNPNPHHVLCRSPISPFGINSACSTGDV